MTAKGLLPRELAARVGVRQGDIWTWCPGQPAEQDVEIVGFGTQGDRYVIETRQVMPGGFSRKETEWNTISDFVQRSVFTCEVAQRATSYDKK